MNLRTIVLIIAAYFFIGTKNGRSLLKSGLGILDKKEEERKSEVEKS